VQHHPQKSTMNTLVWSDEFNGAVGTPPDATKWSPDVGGDGWGNSQMEYDTDNANAYHDGQGNLVLEARKDNPANYQCWYGPCQYTSARITTKNLFSFTHGRIEARIKIPYGQGLWPAFWMLGCNIDSVGWPACGEIDIMENIGKEPSIVHATVHGPNYAGSSGMSGSYTLPIGHLSDSYHIYSTQWDGNHIAFFVDGINYFAVTRATIEAQGNQWIFDHPFYILLNVAIGGWASNPDATTTFPQKMYVSYIRVYRNS
jgi:beta-glucanase (GH16 family)